jgi:membrane-associated phospholipid phosphatase
MLKQLAWGLSVLFHPLLIPSYMLLLLLMINPYLFGVSYVGDQGGRLLLLLVFLYTFFMPAVSVAVMYFLGMFSDISMPDKQDRIGPYLVTGMLYLWVYYNFAEGGQMPPAYVSFMLGTVIALFLAFFINIFSKISAHAVGMGGLVGMVVITLLLFSYGSFAVFVRGLGTVEVSMNVVLMASIIIAGLVGTARLFLKAHQPMDVFGGYLVGFAAQIIALRFIF